MQDAIGISTAPEEYQRRQDQAVEGLPGVSSIIDDILVYGEGDTEEEPVQDHDKKLKALMERWRERGLVLNKDKRRLREKDVRFIGHLITAGGLKPDPEKVKAVNDMPNPTNVAVVRRFLGFMNYLIITEPKWPLWASEKTHIDRCCLELARDS